MAQHLPEIALPAELLREIVQLLPLDDQRTLTLTSQSIRDQVLLFIFGHLRYTGYDVPAKVRHINQARQDVKDAIRKLELGSRALGGGKADSSIAIFEFLQTLPNLQVFIYRQLGPLISPSELSQLLSSLRHAPILELGIHTGMYNAVEGPLVIGLSGLQKLSITWPSNDIPDEPGSSVAHLFALIQPSLTTLVELFVDYTPEELSAPLDLRLLSPAGNTLQVFEYTLQSPDDKILDIIPEIFPDLTKLAITWDNVIEEHSLLWKDAHILSLAKNNNLIELTLSSDFEVDAEDEVRADQDYAWFVRSYTRRLKATQDVATACPRLQRCNWVQMRIGKNNTSMTHPFIIEEQTSDGKQVRHVRGIKQQWMGKDRIFWRDNSVVKCKLEDLPGDIIGENDPPEEDHVDEEGEE
ncbi:hypothetical protein BDN70DRAFT_873103 [Pholiota conissans]|uniref:F-box domain-containing protein n=1 Tax=Pholiota conissans TaxID=109636 RepID=A0A9P6CXD1_9AGAR|nr:hypothetical protein BDN70DRAFT_873103 [Pholiota conissans]